MPNENVLEGYACPKCQSESPFNIDAQTTFLRVDDDGYTETMGMDWNDTSTFSCCTCWHSGEAQTFRVATTEKDSKCLNFTKKRESTCV